MTSWLDEDLADLARRGLRRRRRRPLSGQGPCVRLGGRTLVNFASNDYLNLASDARLSRAAARAARRYGCGTGASPLVSGYLPPLRALERALARWEGTEDTLVFSSGYAANLAVVGTLADHGDAVFSDACNHASLIDGCRLARAAVHVYRHADVGHLDELLGRYGRTARRRLIVTDGLFSMDGDLAPLPGLIELARRHECLLVVDEAHASGVLGPCGRGVTELLLGGVSAEPDRLIKVGTLSKALGCQGGFVCGSRRLIEWLVNRARPYIFSTALAPPLAAAAAAAVRLVVAEPERRQRLLAQAAQLRRRLAERGFAADVSHYQIVPVIVGGAREAVDWSARLRQAGLLVPAIRPPSVPDGGSRLRISLTAGHTTDDVARLVEALAPLCCSLNAGRTTPLAESSSR